MGENDQCGGDLGGAREEHRQSPIISVLNKRVRRDERERLERWRGMKHDGCVTRTTRS